MKRMILFFVFIIAPATLFAIDDFFVPVQSSGTVQVSLHPTENVSAGAPVQVTFGVPFPRGWLTDITKVRVLKNGVEIPAFVEAVTPWRHANNPAFDGTSIRVVRIQIDYTFSVNYPNSEVISVEWGLTARLLNRPSLNAVRNAWHLVNTIQTSTGGPTFSAADKVYEPNVYAVLPKIWLVNGSLKPRMAPLNGSIGEARVNPGDASKTFPGYVEFDQAEVNFFYTTINEDDPLVAPANQNPFLNDYEPWLYDRAMAMYVGYLRSGFFKFLREAVRNSEFYMNHVYKPSDCNNGRCVGSFSLKNPDPLDSWQDQKYSYNENLAMTFWLTGDDSVLPYIEWVTQVYDDVPTAYSYGTPWTERHTGLKLLSHVVAYEVTGKSVYKNTMNQILTDFRLMQTNPYGGVHDGGLWHAISDHEGDAYPDAITSAWMSALLVDAAVRMYQVSEDVNIPQLVIGIAKHVRDTGTYWTNESWTTQENGLSDVNGGEPSLMVCYLTTTDGHCWPTEFNPYNDFEHSPEVAGIAAWGAYFSALGESFVDAQSLAKCADDLYVTFSYTIDYWTRPGGPAAGLAGYRLSPPRKYAWWFKNASHLAWARLAVESTISNAGPPAHWVPKGVGGGGALYSPSFSPLNANELYMACDMSDLFHTTNLGNTWDVVNFKEVQSARASQVQFTNNPSILYTIDNSYDIAVPTKSVDGGATWTPLSADPTYGEAYTVFADPANSNRVIVSNYNTIYFSGNGGTSFSQVYLTTDYDSGVHLAGVFFDGNNIFIGTSKGLLVSTNGGGTFSVSNVAGIPNTEQMTSFSGAKQNGVIRFFCVTSNTGIWAGITGDEFWGFQNVYSMDWGQTNWIARGSGIPTGHLPFFVSMAANNISVAYVAGSNGDTGAPIVDKLVLSGNVWQIQDVFRTSNNQNIFTGWSGDGGDRGWSYGEYALGFNVAPNDANKAVITDLGFAHLTTDGGATWRQIYVNAADQNPSNAPTPKKEAYRGVGLENTTCWGITWANANRMIASFSDIQGIVSSDAGDSWSFNYTGHNQNSMYQSIKHPVSGTLYAATADVHDMYQSTRLADSILDNGGGKVLYSTDNGSNWLTLHDFGHSVIWLVTDPNNPNRLYASVIHSTLGGIYVSSNIQYGAASTWAKLANPPRTQGHPFNIHVLNDGTLVATYSGRRDGSGAFTSSSGVFVSTNNGVSWIDRSSPNMLYWTKDLVIDPYDAAQNTWYVGVFSGWGGAPNGLGGLFKTTNRGQTWTKIFNSDRVTSCAISPVNADEMYVTTETEGLWYCQNLTSVTPTFAQVDTYPFRQPERVFFNPFNSDEIWVTSFGNGMRLGTLNNGGGSNQPPTANAGADQILDEASAVALSGSGSDPENGALTYQWTRTAGPAVTLTNANTAAAGFNAPLVNSNTNFTFQLTVRDEGNLTGQDSVIVTVRPSPDSDQDGLRNAQESVYGTDPNDADSDDDGFNDGAEVGAGTNPLAAGEYPGVIKMICDNRLTAWAVINGTSTLLGTSSNWAQVQIYYVNPNLLGVAVMCEDLGGYGMFAGEYCHGTDCQVFDGYNTQVALSATNGWQTQDHSLWPAATELTLTLWGNIGSNFKVFKPVWSTDAYNHNKIYLYSAIGSNLAMFKFTCDNTGQLFSDGVKILENNSWKAPRFTVKSLTQLIAMYGHDLGGIAACNCEVNREKLDNTTLYRQTIKSDTSWKGVSILQNNWSDPLTSDAVWPKAFQVSPSGGSPWGVVASLSGNWIWAGTVMNDAYNNNDAYLRKTVGPIPNETIYMAADNGYTAYWNGVQIGSSTNWMQAGIVQVFAATNDVLAVKGMGGGGQEAVLIQGAGAFNIFSDGSCKVSSTLFPGWELRDFDDSGWANATEYGVYGTAPWYKKVVGMQSNSPARWIWSNNYTTNKTIYLRKKIQ